MLNHNGMGMITKYQNVKLPGYPGNLGMEGSIIADNLSLLRISGLKVRKSFFRYRESGNLSRPQKCCPCTCHFPQGDQICAKPPSTNSSIPVM